MFANFFLMKPGARSRKTIIRSLALSLVLFLAMIPLLAQDQSSQQRQTPPQASDQGKPKQDAPAESGGPGGDMGPYAIPRKS